MCMGVVSLDMMGWVGAGMKVVDGMHVGLSQGGWRCWSISRVRGDTPMTSDHNTGQVRSSG